MPRLAPSLLRRAHTLSPLLPLVLRGSRTLDSAVHELRWLREHVKSLTLRPRETRQQKSHFHPRPRQPRDPAPQIRDRQRILLRLCQRRARSEPLQYILGSQPFGKLDIRCRMGVLIPRPETEAYTTHVAKLLLENELHPATSRAHGRLISKPLRILDLCSGSGCISLLLHSLLKTRKPYLKILGLDISPKAISLSRQNLRHNMRAGLLARAAKRHVQFRRYDVLSPSLIDEQLWETWAERSSANPGEDGAQIREERGQEGEERERNRVDIIISNPPYISQRAFDTETTRSVRNWEPRLALIPSDASTGTDDKQHAGKGGGKVPKIVGGVEVEDEDIFYVRLMAIHDLRYSKVCVMEVGDEEQAQRVVVLFNHLPLAHYNRIEFWRDQPSSSSAPGEDIFMFHKPGGHHIPFPVRGTGKIRAVVLFRDRLMPRHKHGSKWHEGERHEGESRMREKNESKRYGRQRERAGDDRPRF